MKSNKQLINVGIYVFDGVEELDFVGVHEVLSLVNRVRNQSLLKIRILGTKRKIKCVHGLIVCPERLFLKENPADYKILIVPGGKGVQKLLQSKPVLRKIRSFSESGIMLASVCTGAFLLGEAGVLSGKKATTHFLHLKKLQAYCHAVRRRVIQDGNVVTSGGIACSLDLGLYLLQTFYGKKIAADVSRRLEYRV